MRITPLLLALALSPALAACASFVERPVARAELPRDLGGLIYRGADRILDTAPGIASNKPIIIATAVDVDNLSASSTFGRLASQLVSSRFSQRGYLVKDVTYTGALMVTETGEMVLSREAARIAAEQDAQAVVAAAYAVGGEKIYLNLRLLAAADGRVLSAADVVVPLDPDTHRMVLTGRPAPERRAQVVNGRLN